MKCLECGAEFEPRTVMQKYCSGRCRDKYKRKHDMDIFYPSVTFTCSQCGRTVVTAGGTKDKRTRFCSRECEKKYWKHPHYEYLTGRTNFHSAAEYASWERRTNA